MSYFQNLVDQVMGELEAQTPQLKKEPLRGDLIVVTYDNTKCYGIYLSNDQIIHCKAKESEITISSLSAFLKNQTYFAILNFERLRKDLFGENGRSFSSSSTSPGGFEVKNTAKRFLQFFSADETISRAKRYLNNQKSKPQVNDCQSFVLWAKTGSQECNTLLQEKYWDVVSF